MVNSRGRYRDTGYVERFAIRAAEDEPTAEEIATLEGLVPPTPTTVYYLHTADHELLYVGVSGRTLSRFGQHAHDKPWWHQVGYASMEHFPTRAEALQREAQAIRELRPKHNVVTPKVTKVNEFGVRFCAAGCGGAAPDNGATCARCVTRAYRERKRNG